jgi:excinuclease ABC subunit C
MGQVPRALTGPVRAEHKRGMDREATTLLTGRKAASRARMHALRATVISGAEARPGVYRMISEDGAVLYVGKSKSLRTRLLGYFRSGPRDKGARILRETHGIEWEHTPSELAALLQELRLIKRYRPRFNVASKRDLRHYAFIRVGAGRAPKITVHRGARAAGDGLYYGPFIGPDLVAKAVRELSDALGLRDCADHVPMIYSDQPELIPLGLRAPGCIRYEIKKCLGPCVAGCSAGAYDAQVKLARAFLEGATFEPVERLRRDMDAASAAEAYERAAMFRDKLHRLERLRDQFVHMRFALESLSFVYPVPGFGGDDRVYLIRRGTVRAERPAPRSTPERFELQRLIDEVFQPGEPPKGPVRLHEIDEILLLSSWFRRFPDELAKTWSPAAG